MRRSSTYFCRSLKREKDQLQQRLHAQQEASAVPQASSAESEVQVKGLQEQLSQSEELLQVGTASECRNQHSLMRFLQAASTKAQDIPQRYNEETAIDSHGAGQACVCHLMLVQWHLEEHSCLTCNNRSSVVGKEGIILLLLV